MKFYVKINVYSIKIFWQIICLNNNMKNYITYITLFVLTGCAVLEKSEIKDFKIKEATYQYWMLNEDERGVEIHVVIKTSNPKITFESIIFNNFKLPVSIEKSNGLIILKAHHAMGRLSSKFNKRVESENQIIYNVDKVKKSIFIERFKRKKMKYYTSTSLYN